MNHSKRFLSVLELHKFFICVFFVLFLFALFIVLVSFFSSWGEFYLYLNIQLAITSLFNELHDIN